MRLLHRSIYPLRLGQLAYGWHGQSGEPCRTLAAYSDETLTSVKSALGSSMAGRNATRIDCANGTEGPLQRRTGLAGSDSTQH